MLRHQMTSRIFLFAAVVVAAAGSAHATIFPAGVPIPPSEVILNFNNTGLDWTYAGPVAPNEFGPGQIEPPSYRAAEGWRFATAAEWAVRPAWQDFTRPGFPVPPAVDGWNNHVPYRFTSEYWSTFSHVDLRDADIGNITNGFDIGLLNGVYETFYVRTGVIPEPTALALLGLSSLGLLRCVRRRS